MGSVRIVYDTEGDILDVDFRLTGKKPQRGIELHDNVTLWTDAAQTIPLRLMLLSYSQLLEQSGLSFDNLKQLPSQQRIKVLKLLTHEPLKRLLICLNEEEFRFQVIEPKVKELAAA
jgi:hypothetical protein